jgi:hypothetical protein
MAQYQHLPIYKVTYELLQQITKVTKDSFLRERAHFVALILERMQVIELLVRLSKDMRLINIKAFSETVALTDSIGRQAQGWLKTVKPLSAE